MRLITLDVRSPACSWSSRSSSVACTYDGKSEVLNQAGIMYLETVVERLVVELSSVLVVSDS